MPTPRGGGSPRFGADVKWRAERRMMYDREVDVPRLVSHFRLDPPASGEPQAILDAAAA